MQIEETLNFLDETLNDISHANIKTHVQPCPHCKILIRYPIIARRQDVDNFHLIMNVASRIMKEYGITGNLLAEIRAQCIIQALKNNASQDSPDEN